MINDSIPRIRYSSHRLISHCIESVDGSVSMKGGGERIELMKSDGIEVGCFMHNETCYICLDDFVDGEGIRLLRCKHGFHDKCIESWIIEKGKCPICKRDAFESV